MDMLALQHQSVLVHAQLGEQKCIPHWVPRYHQMDIALLPQGADTSGKTFDLAFAVNAVLCCNSAAYLRS